MSLTTSKNAPPNTQVKLLGISLASILLVFALLSYFTLSRLASFESALVQFADQGLPNLINTSQLFNQAALLLQSTELLSKSSSQASKRIVQKQLENNLQTIRTAAQSIQNNEFLDIQFDIINTELNEFSTLVGQRLELRNQMESLKLKISILSEQVTQVDPAVSAGWLLEYLQALININQALDERKLQRVRFLFGQLQKHLVKLNNTADPVKNNLVKKHMINELNTLLFATDGLVALKIQTLRIEGKVVGRENFVHHLIEDYVANLGFVTQETEQKLTEQVAASINEMQQQTLLVGYLLAASVMVLLAIVLIFQRRLFKRLNHLIRSESKGVEHTES